MVRKLVKRCFDIVFSIVFLVLFIPLWIIIPALIKLDSSGRVIFKQKRVGLNSQYFTMHKFRTMKEGVPDLPAEEVSDHSGMYTKVGVFLRRFSIDEIPQLINILKGDMSFVGPRPSHLGQHLQIKIRKETRTDSMRPGLTGLAQINGRDDISVLEKARYDKIYVYDSSIFLDIKIIFTTIKIVLSGKGAN